MNTCDDCGGEGGYAAPDQGSRWADDLWIDCPSCNGSGWVDEMPPDLGMDDLDERCGQSR